MIAADEENPESANYYVSYGAKVNTNIAFDEVDKECAVQWIYLGESGEKTGETVTNQPLARRRGNSRNPLGRSFSAPP